MDRKQVERTLQEIRNDLSTLEGFLYKHQLQPVQIGAIAEKIGAIEDELAK